MRNSRFIVWLFLVILFTLVNFYFRPTSKNALIDDEYRNSSAYINDLYKSDEYFRKHILQGDEANLYGQIVEDIKTGVDRTEIDCAEECGSLYMNIYYSLYLDHPEFISFQSATAWEEGKHLSIHYHSLTPLRTFFGTRRIERELDIIRRETKNMNEKEKIIYVYEYVAGHDYDKLFTYSNSNQSAYSFFTKGTSVCAGFAKASQIIFQNIGVNSYLVMNEDHMWNYVEYEGEYYVFDATVGASYTNKKHHNFYEGLGRTTVDTITGMFPDLYPEINKKPLKEIFGL